MYVNHPFSLSGGEPAVFDYCCDSFGQADSPVVVYRDYKLTLLLTDGLAAVIGENVYDIRRGDLIVFRPEEIHFGRFMRSGVHRYLDFFVPADFFGAMSPGCCDLMRPFLDSSSARINRLDPDDDTRARLLRIGERLAELSAGLDGGSPDPAVDALLLSGMIELLSITRELYAEQCRRPPSSAAPPVVSRTIRSLNEHFTEPNGLAMLAEEVGCSVSYMTRTFRRYTGKSIHAYLLERRIEHAKSLLRSGCSVTESCYRSGFSECSNFIKIFSKAVGVTPNRYKRSLADDPAAGNGREPPSDRS